ncbi:uncharacterized protein LOC120668545 isoform X1 [Panicum virgatum]|uniref:uncharacterized protein LOC120668545 isoform X1 n=1 Tax=Panicum virgatum TaxID=38727 RepID=UPI0019D57F10|nr:uncharacterized protein LOC120668545 isoform X1 [Panicum virgatum]XP_039804216.1 uncharacterized protein LOC120668545 isoform X1 [Panicum virgatum]XP_039804217.1 uncharacterized protein LOC120668545 isoform X1 [Panicum virgatum]
MVHAIREKGVIMFEKRRRISRALHGVILPAVIHQLNAASKGIGHLKVTKGLPDQAEVTEIYKDEEVRRHVVYLNEQNCTCREWQVIGKPCPHALAVLTTERQPDYEKYVDMAYSVQRLRQAYDLGWPNITDMSQWPEYPKDFKLFPPVGKKRGVGRQRKNRIPSCLERTGKVKRQVKCIGCGEKGHRQDNWRRGLTGTKKKEREPKRMLQSLGGRRSQQPRRSPKQSVMMKCSLLEPAQGLPELEQQQQEKQLKQQDKQLSQKLVKQLSQNQVKQLSQKQVKHHQLQVHQLRGNLHWRLRLHQQTCR